jgi:hypothetical protein
MAKFNPSGVTVGQLAKQYNKNPMPAAPTTAPSGPSPSLSMLDTSPEAMLERNYQTSQQAGSPTARHFSRVNYENRKAALASKDSVASLKK